MNNMEEKKLFLVEFGEPDIAYNKFSMNYEPAIFVIARDYNEAANKAMIYIESKQKTEESRSVLTEDGSLNNAFLNSNKKEKKPEIRAIKFAGEVIL